MDPTVLDGILTLQFVIAWAGESGEEPRLKWWQTDLCSEFGGEDLFQQLLPSTWRWSVLEAARRTDAKLHRAAFLKAHPDKVREIEVKEQKRREKKAKKNEKAQGAFEFVSNGAEEKA